MAIVLRLFSSQSLSVSAMFCTGDFEVSRMRHSTNRSCQGLKVGVGIVAAQVGRKSLKAAANAGLSDHGTLFCEGETNPGHSRGMTSNSS